MLRNGTSLRKSAPWPPNISAEDASCSAPATKKAAFQILFQCPTPAIIFENTPKTFTFESLLTWCRIHCACHAKYQNDVSTSKRREHVVFLAFWLGKCASHHNGVHFFNVSTSKNALTLTCFVRFDLETCFAPQRRTLFPHLNFQECSEPRSF